MVGKSGRPVLKRGAPVRFVFGLRKVRGKVVEAIVPPRAGQPVVYRVTFRGSEADSLEVVLRETDLTPVRPLPASRRGSRVSG